MIQQDALNGCYENEMGLIQGKNSCWSSLISIPEDDEKRWGEKGEWGIRMELENRMSRGRLDWREGRSRVGFISWTIGIPLWISSIFLFFSLFSPLIRFTPKKWYNNNYRRRIEERKEWEMIQRCKRGMNRDAEMWWWGVKGWWRRSSSLIITDLQSISSWWYFVLYLYWPTIL